jgi:hypothetical protein
MILARASIYPTGDQLPLFDNAVQANFLDETAHIECDEEDDAPAAPGYEQRELEALDELFTVAGTYHTTAAYHKLLRFVSRFRWYSPFNAMLVQMQMDGAQYVATAARWKRAYLRSIRADARPLVMLRPKGPVMFVFDVSDTEPLQDAPPLPPEVLDPFAVRKGELRRQYELTLANVIRDGVDVTERKAGSQSAGLIKRAQTRERLKFQIRLRPDPKYQLVPHLYDVLLNANHSREARYATLVHELGHLLCGRIGTPDPDWWPDRQYATKEIRELEAESVSYLVCRRLGIDSPSDEYIASYMGNHDAIAGISLDAVMKAATLIEQMGRERLKPRQQEKKKA